MADKPEEIVLRKKLASRDAYRLTPDKATDLIMINSFAKQVLDLSEKVYKQEIELEASYMLLREFKPFAEKIMENPAYEELRPMAKKIIRANELLDEREEKDGSEKEKRS